MTEVELPEIEGYELLEDTFPLVPMNEYDLAGWRLRTLARLSAPWWP